MTIVYGLFTGCGDPGIDPASLRFGQLGEVHVTVETPLQAGIGRVVQTLSWHSDGAWALSERISYQERTGDHSVIRNPGAAAQFLTDYIGLINSVATGPTNLFVPELDTMPNAECGIAASTVRVLIKDHAKRENREWSRCSYGYLESLQTSGSGPDPEASRVVTAAIEARNRTVGPEYLGPYFGSVPFGTLEKGDQSQAKLRPNTEDEGCIFCKRFSAPPGAAADAAPTAWLDFWQTHTGGARPVPEVDWSREMVLVGAVGPRPEAGDSVEIRGVFGLGEGIGTRVAVFERIPGDFCAPAYVPVYPYHIVVTTRASDRPGAVLPEPVFFTTVTEERVPCDGL